MMKVIVRRAGTQVAAASSLLIAASGTAGCVIDAEPGGEAISQHGDAIVGGSATLVANGWPGAVSLTVTGSTTDELVRITEALSFNVPAWMLWDTIHPNTSFPNLARLQQLQPTVTVLYFDQGVQIGSATLSTSWTGAQAETLSAVTSQFTVPAQVDTLKFEIALTDAGDPAASAEIDADAITAIPVFGGELPDKSALFDTSYSTFRTRVVEGDLPVKGADVTLGYTDWRADALAERSTINTQIGVREAWGRFGVYTMPIYGTIVHEVSVGHYFDDGGGWRSEQALAPVAGSRLLSASAAGRTAYEKTLAIPANATILSMYFHVKTYLVANYQGQSGVTQQWYTQGSQNLVRERWDNPYGPYSNHDLSLQSP
jgi:hypothetical protein